MHGSNVILITGGTGAGKTTYALKLAAEMGAIRFSIDDWMTHLFWMDAPDPPDFDWVMKRIGRAEAIIRGTAEQCLANHVPVILDLGFTKSCHRKAFGDWATSLGQEPVLHWVDVSAETRWARVETRNMEKGETFAMTVDRDMFDFMENEWEPPQDNEMVIRRV